MTFLEFLQQSGNAYYGAWSISYESGRTGLTLYKRLVYYNEKEIGTMSACASQWIMYEGRVPPLKRPPAPPTKNCAQRFANPQRESIILACLLDQKGKRNPRRDGWKMIPFP